MNQDDDDLDEEEALRQALAMNEELKRMAAEADGLAHYESVQQSYGTGTLPRDRDLGRNLRKPTLAAAPKPDKRTFSNAPDSLKFKRPVKSDYTHGNGRMTDIAIENQALAQKLRSIDINGGTTASKQHKVAAVSSSTINRKKKQSSIDIENARIHARLQSVKPTKTLSGNTLKKEHQTNMKHAANCSRVRDKPVWDDRFVV
mmetsp:Transcript_767/g.1368  ORF Transcript_767/g.1368 Transcript_767/m.1368 type:complete len:202 (+) Transcript_767:119-724(+)|eukprot:CAMPEP_0198211730 /NCGR_PEP_ID=MMETSP1445-20131203/25295_1 /TAXON_ID=36898 /ORGANISM="Pyramimonas sp., Strain CCMP2087" /LENGTH=201 /DNA_ID=CAMNT_0043886055 /DNA_START=113 /DNA_END=718 /DNA_ORIENTATION=-